MHVCFILSEHSKSSFVSVINVQTSAICFPLNVLWLSLFFVWLQPSSFQALGHEILFFLITSLSQSFHNQTLATYFLEGKLISFVFSYLSYWSRVPGEGISHIIEVVFFFFPTHRLKQKRPLLNLQILLYLKFEIHCWEPQISQLLTHLLSSSLHTLLWTSVLINSVNRLSATYIRNIIYCSLIYRFQLMLFWKKVIQKSIWFLENF